MASWYEEPTIKEQFAASSERSFARRESDHMSREERAEMNRETGYIVGRVAVGALVVALGVSAINYNRAHAETPVQTPPAAHLVEPGK